MSPDTHQSMSCSVSSCSCTSFRPGRVQIRSCDLCAHSWVKHALQKQEARRASSCGPVEVAVPGLVLDLSSLVLYGAQAVPVKLKILLDRLYSILTPEQVGHILLTLGWTLADYVRGYKLQDPSGRALDQWLMATADEEQLVLKQFLRFGETRPIVELMTHGFNRDATLMELHCTFSNAAQYLCPAAKEAGPSDRSSLQKPNGTKMAEKLNVTVKPDPDKPLLKQDPSFPPLSRLCPSVLSHSSSSLNPTSDHLPSISSSFFCPLPSFLPVTSVQTTPSPCSSVGGRKGRVCCGVCGKSFYDKGTLKIHYNAVHLKIKHRCTVAGCTMVFSSLRSRNRHSANPNPRLHTNSAQHKDGPFHKTLADANETVKKPQNPELWRHDDHYRKCDFLIQNGLESDLILKRDTLPPPQANSSPDSLQSVENKPLHSIPGLVPDSLEDSDGQEISHCSLTRHYGATSHWRWDPAPKKKPRKSSMPVKIEREKVDGRKSEEERL